MRRWAFGMGVALMLLMLLAGPAAATTVQYQVAASGNDAYATSGSGYYGSSTLYFPYGSDARRAFFRWPLGVPAGATIQSAYLKIKSNGVQGSAATSVARLQLLDFDDCASFTGNPYAWSVTASYVDWTLPSSWTSGDWHTSGDLKTLVQEYVNRGGYATGQYLGLRATWVSGNWKQAYQYDNSAADGAILEVTYGVNQAPVANAGSDQTVTDTDLSGSETVTLDGSASSDSDGTIASYVWTEGANQIATGASPQATLAVGAHTITLTVTDNNSATASDTVDVTVGPGTTMVQYQIAASGNDAYATSGSGYYGSSTLYFPYGSDARRAFFRWPLDVPAGATIQSAYLKVKSNGVQGSAATSVARLQLLDFDDCANFTGNPYAWSVTASYVDWTLPSGWTSGDWYTSGDLKTLVQEYVNRGGYATGQYLGLRATWVSGNWKQAYQYDNSAADGAILEVTYAGGGGGQNQAPVADAGSDQTVTDTDSSGSETVTLDGSASSDSDGTISSYAWQESGNQIASGATPSYSFVVGTHTVTLITTDNDGATDDDTVIITVQSGGANVAPVANAGSDAPGIDNDGSGGESVTLNGSASSDSDGTITSYVWNEDGSQVATGATANVSLSVGRHDIQLTVTDDDGATGRDVVRIWIAPQGDYFVDAAAGLDTNPGTAAQPFKTIGKGCSVATAGKTIIVRQGVYREGFSLGVSGSAGNPITLMGYPLERVALSGSDALSGWTQCTQQIAQNNPNYANIYYKDIAWKPTRVYQDGVELQTPRSPDYGWWIVSGGTLWSITDTANLTQADDFWNGATGTLFDASADSHQTFTVTDFDAATRTLTVAGLSATPQAGVDSICLSDSVRQIDGQGQWYYEDLGGGNYRLFVWALGGGDADGYLVEANRRSYGISTGSRSYWTFDNLEVCHYQNNIGIGIGTVNSGSAGHFTVQNCLFHHNHGYGLCLSDAEYSVVRNNTMAYNRYGLSLINCSFSTVENNDVGYNWEDGVRITGPTAGYCEGMLLARNFIHDHVGKNHPDNIQSFNYCHDWTIEENLVINGGQSMMLENDTGLVIRNNVVLGSGAVSVIYGGNNTSYDGVVEHNTIAYSGYGSMTPTATNFELMNNICVTGHNNAPIVSIPAGLASWVQDYNCFWVAPAYSKSPIVYDSHFNWLWSDYLTNTGRDANSAVGDPLFTHAPVYFTRCDEVKQGLATPTRAYVPTADITLFEVGDHVEFDWDGVMREVTAVGANYIDFTPGAGWIATDVWMVANWKEMTETQLDLTLDANSPARNADEDGNDMGSDLYPRMNDYMQGDFNRDGRRDVPELPAP